MLSVHQDKRRLLAFFPGGVGGFLFCLFLAFPLSPVVVVLGLFLSPFGLFCFLFVRLLSAWCQVSWAFLWYAGLGCSGWFGWLVFVGVCPLRWGVPPAVGVGPAVGGVFSSAVCLAPAWVSVPSLFGGSRLGVCRGFFLLLVSFGLGCSRWWSGLLALWRLCRRSFGGWALCLLRSSVRLRWPRGFLLLPALFGPFPLSLLLPLCSFPCPRFPSLAGLVRVSLWLAAACALSLLSSLPVRVGGGRRFCVACCCWPLCCALGAAAGRVRAGPPGARLVVCGRALLGPSACPGLPVGPVALVLVGWRLAPLCAVARLSRGFFAGFPVGGGVLWLGALFLPALLLARRPAVAWPCAWPARSGAAPLLSARALGAALPGGWLPGWLPVPWPALLCAFPPRGGCGCGWLRLLLAPLLPLAVAWPSLFLCPALVLLALSRPLLLAVVGVLVVALRWRVLRVAGFRAGRFAEKPPKRRAAPSGIAKPPKRRRHHAVIVGGIPQGRRFLRRWGLMLTSRNRSSRP